MEKLWNGIEGVKKITEKNWETYPILAGNIHSCKYVFILG